MMPWWLKVDMAFIAVVSWPPPGLPEETKSPAYLPQKAPELHCPPVESQKVFHCAGKLP
jgi:hypothetical protein